MGRSIPNILQPLHTALVRPCLGSSVRSWSLVFPRGELLLKQGREAGMVEGLPGFAHLARMDWKAGG